MKDLERVDERYPLNSRLVKKNGKIVEEVYRLGGLYDPQIRDVMRHLESGHPVRHGADGEGAARAHSVVPHRRRARPARVRHRLGRRQVVARRHDQRVHRGLSRRPRHQGRVGSARLLRQHDEDRRHQEARRRSAVVREPHAVGPAVLQGERAGRHRQRHRRRHRDRRCRTGDADRHQPAERTGSARAVRQQVGLDLQCERSLRRSMDAGFRSEFSWSPDEVARAREVAGRSRTSSPPICTRSSGMRPGGCTRSSDARRRPC